MTACGTVVGSLLATGSRVRADALVRLDMAAAIAGPAIAGLRSFELASVLAHTDPLTSLPNQRAAEESAEQLVALARRAAHSLAALRLDVDGLARLNDRLGTETGDGVIAGVGALLRARLRTSDVVARIGGDEFLAILPDTSVETAVALAQGLRGLVGEMTPPTSPDPVTVSVGVAAFPQDADDVFGLLAAAERALLSAKSAGGNRVFAVEPPDPWALLDDAL
jgi:diguanylate cyclase (GGDEF)-like protein